MAAENMLKHCSCYDKPYEYIDFMIESCKIDIIPLDVDPDKLLGVFGKDKNDYKFIGFNKNMITERILFTKAHELGHFILEHNLKGEFLTDDSFKSKDPQETEANIFAAALLMPKQAVFEVIKSILGDSHGSISNPPSITYEELSTQEKYNLTNAMKNKFHTSDESIYWRLYNLVKK